MELHNQEASRGSYGPYSLRPLTKIINDEINSGNDVLSALHLSRKYPCSFREAQLALVAMTWSGELKTQYQVMCSGPGMRRDIDLELNDITRLPRVLRRCHVCMEEYIPTDENIFIYFTPTDFYKALLRDAVPNNAGRVDST